MSPKRREIGIDQICNLISLETKNNPKTIRKILEATYSVILKQLELNDRIYFYNFGAFEISERPGGDKRMGDPVNGGTIVRYIKPKNMITFLPSSVFDKAVNEGNFQPPPTKRKPYKKSQVRMMKEYYKRNKVDNKPTVEEILVKALNVSQARKTDDKWEIEQEVKRMERDNNYDEAEV